ncbi:M14 family metallopeptidase [Anaerostipes sp.]|uniref:M14 family metallopeptidase n=1 Tax=Anaerostipes sp. TaxID=1872530 RepID=UPI003FF0E98B
MIKTVASAPLPAVENYIVKKQRLQPEILSGKEKRISVVTGIHGDELEGQYVCYEIQRRIKEQQKCLHGIVDIYPALNPLGIDSITRGIPHFDLDMNRIFPGNSEGSMAEYIASKIIDDVKGSDLCFDIHASNIFLCEIPQVRINELCADILVPFAKRLNIDYVWIHGAATVLESTFAHSLNTVGTPVLVVEMGVGMRVTKEYCKQLVDGIFVEMKDFGIWSGEVIDPKEPLISTDGQVHYLNAGYAGVFLPTVKHWTNVKAGEKIGEILNPLEGTVKEEIYSDCDGILFTLREYPVVSEGSLIGRILERQE